VLLVPMISVTLYTLIKLSILRWLAG